MLNESERLQKVLSHAGVVSRRKAEEAISQGAVTVNGKVVKVLGTKVNPYTDKIEYMGERIKLTALQDKRVWILNKPRGVISSTKDPEGRETVRDYLPKEAGHVYPMGRLDFNSEGLILMTNDGELANRMLHPRYGLTKIYHVKIKGKLPMDIRERFLNGIKLEDGRAKFEKITLIEYLSSSDKSWIEVVVREGRNRLIRRMFEKYGILVDRLRRVQFGPLTLGSLKFGEIQELDDDDKEQLYKFCGLDYSG